MDIDLWGNPIREEPARNGRRYLRMQEMHGTLRGKTCKTCKHCICREQNCRFYHKCELWVISSSEATDIRLKDVACGRYEGDGETSGIEVSDHFRDLTKKIETGKPREIE